MPVFIREILFRFVRKVFVREAGDFHFWIMGLALVLGASGLIYFQIVDYVDPSMNLVRYCWNEYLWGDPAASYKEQNPDAHGLNHYVFYAGKPGGYYHKIGSRLEEEWEADGQGDLTMISHGGSTKIARAVYTNQRALGIVQEDVLRDLDLTDDKVQIIAPLYDELVHVFYRRDAFRGARRIGGPDDDARPELHPEKSQPWRYDFERAVARIQSTPAPGFPLGYYLLHFSNVFPHSYRAASIEETIAALSAAPGAPPEERLDLAVVIAGAPLANVEGLDFGRVGLMPVAPDLTRLINPTMNISLRPSGFAGVYDALMRRAAADPENENTGDIPTLASRAMLIASRDVPSWVIRDVGELLEGMKAEAEQARATLAAATAARDSAARPTEACYGFPLSKYPFGDAIRKEYPGMTRQLIPMWLLFLTVMFLCSRTIYNVLTWAISNYKHAKYSRLINDVYKRLPNNSLLTGVGTPEPMPAIDANHEFRINQLVMGVSTLLKLAEEIRDDFVSGGIQVGHQSNLIDTLYGVKAIFQRQLAQRINEALLNGFPVDRLRIRRLYTAGYIEMPAYCTLCGLADRVAEMRPLDALAENGAPPDATVTEVHNVPDVSDTPETKTPEKSADPTEQPCPDPVARSSPPPP